MTESKHVGIVAVDSTRTLARAAVPDKSSDLCFMSARDLATLIRNQKVSAHEVTAAYLKRINRLNPKINAIVAKLDDDRCLALADEADRRMVRGEGIGPLHGLPIAFRDLEPAAVLG
jgi:amidase